MLLVVEIVTNIRRCRTTMQLTLLNAEEMGQNRKAKKDVLLHLLKVRRRFLIWFTAFYMAEYHTSTRFRIRRQTSNSKSLHLPATHFEITGAFVGRPNQGPTPVLTAEKRFTFPIRYLGIKPQQTPEVLRIENNTHQIMPKAFTSMMV
jgi:hypothetical protein